MGANILDGMTSSKPAGAHPGVRNPGIAFDPSWVAEATVDEAHLAERASHIGSSDPWAGTGRVEKLLEVVSLLDLTTLSDDDTDARVRELCSMARRPVPPGLLDRLPGRLAEMHTAAVCVFARFVPAARDALRGSDVRVAAVAGGFPDPQGSLQQRVAEIEAAVRDGAEEIDAVITREHVLVGDWHRLYEEVGVLRGACGNARLKTILEAGALGPLENVARSGMVCMMAGADFIKTSTGRERVNATFPIGLTMVHSIRSYAERTGHAVGFKPAGGIRSPQDSLRWLALVHEELGDAWTTAELFRIGASSLRQALEDALEALATR